jgi:hypothetical protein
MADLKPAELAKAIVAAMKGSFGQQWPKVKDFAEGEGKKLATSLAQITKLKLTGQITEGESSVLFEMQKNATRAVLLAIEGMGIIAVEQAINAAIDALRGTVNTAIGFALL